MDIEEIRKEKEELAKAIESLVEDFENKTKIKVYNLSGAYINVPTIKIYNFWFNELQFKVAIKTEEI